MKVLLTRDQQGELAVVKRIAKVMDELITVPNSNLKVGLDAVIGLIPVSATRPARPSACT